MGFFGHHSERYICTNCGVIDDFKRKVSGSFIVEVFLLFIGVLLAATAHWAFILLPIGYTLWRITSGRTVCVSCDSTNKVPVVSPAGKQLLEKYHQDTE